MNGREGPEPAGVREIGQLRTAPVTTAVMALLCVAGCTSEASSPRPRAAQAAGAVYIDAISAPATASFAGSAFVGAQACGVCHAEHYREWQSSPHASAMEDPVFRALVELQRAERGTSQDLFCTQCHSPIGSRSGDIRPGFAFERLEPITRQGVTCESCHRVAALVRDYNAGHVLDPSLPVQGSLGTNAAPHATGFSTLLQSASFCGGCHDVRTPEGVSLESPYEEWLDSPAAAAGIACQDCHMATYTGKATTLPDAPTRATLHRHTFTSVDVPPALLLADGDPERLAELSRASAELLRSAAQLAVEARLDGAAEVALAVTVTNNISGHRFPTGASFNRQFWLAVDAVDANGERVFESGGLDAEGDLADVPAGPPAESGLVVLGAKLVGADGTQTLFSWQAARVRDESIEPLGARVYDYRFTLPSHVALPVRVEARLRFRAFAPRLLRALQLDRLIEHMNVTDLVSASTQVGAGQ